MQEWLSLAWVQYALAPFIAGLIVAELFNRMRLSGLALTAGVAAAFYLGARALPPLSPATIAERIALVTLAATAMGLAFDLMPKLRRAIATAMALAAAALVVWAAWPAVTADNWLVVLAPAGLSMLYAIWTTGTLTLLADFPERASATGVGLGLGAGACALLAGAEPLAQLGFAAAAASGAYLLIQIISNTRLSCGTTFTLPLAAVCALVPPLAVLKSGLSWYLLPALALVAAIGLIPLSERLSTSVRGLLALAIAAAASAGVIALAWTLIGPPVKA